MSEIKKITASRFKDDASEKSEVYRLLNLMHVTAGQCANAKIGGWGLESCYTETDRQECMTTWSNGVISLRAVSDEYSHEYTLEEANND